MPHPHSTTRVTKRAGSFLPHRRHHLAFTLPELLIVIAIMAVGLGTGTVVVQNVQVGTMNAKLAADVKQVNTAIEIYQTGGGSLAGVSDPQGVINKLKTFADRQSMNDRELMFLKESMVDPRLEVVTSTQGRGGFWNWGRKFVRYDSSRERFEVVDTLMTGGFHGFALNDSLGTAGISEETRSMLLKQAKNAPWVWDYDPRTSAASSQPPQSLTGMDTNANNGAPSASNGAVQALPPDFNPLPPQPSLGSYPLSVSLTNPNNTAVSRILYHLEPGPGIDVPYTGPVPVDPAVRVVAYVQSLDQTIYYDSPVAGHTYTPDPVPLNLNDTIPLAYTYPELGGPMAEGSPGVTPLPPGRILLANEGDIPNIYENDSTFRVFWTYDGLDPLSSPAAQPGTSFINGYQGDPVAVVLSHFGNLNSVEIRYAGKSFNPLITQNSPVGVRNVTGNKILLPPPLMTLPPGGAGATGPITISPDIGTGLIPRDYRIFYRLDGVDPGAINGEPSVGAALYTGQINGTPPNSVIAARVYAPIAYKNWFDASPLATLEMSNTFANLYYAVGGNSKVIYVFDSANGNNVVKTSSALYPIECLATDTTNTAVYYVEKSPGDWRLGRYDVTTGAHQDLGKLTEGGFFERPVAQPSNLMFFNDGLYYIHENSDNLVKIELTPGGLGISQQFRAADLTQDAMAFTDIGDLATDTTGKLFISASNVIATYDLRKMGDYTVLQSNPDRVWTGLVYGQGSLFGVSNLQPDKVCLVDQATGLSTSTVDFNPLRPFWDFAGAQAPVPTEPVGGQHYFVTNGYSNIYRLDLATGRNYLVTTLLPLQPTGIAIDRTTSYIYTVGHDNSNRPGDVFLCRYDLTTGGVMDLGSLKAPGLPYIPATYPLCMTFFEGDLYYVPPETDDLVKVGLGAISLTGQVKVSDLIDNSGALGEVDALTIGPDGWLYLSRSDADLLAKYDIVNLTGFTIIKDEFEAAYQALTYDIYGQLHGTFASKPTKMSTVDDLDGSSVFKFDTQPSISVWDITGFFDVRPQPVTKDYFASDGFSTRIFRLDPATGANQLLTVAPWPVDNIAFDADQRRVFYMRKSDFELGVYSMHEGQHEILGRIDETRLNYVATQRPAGLTCFNGALYYVARDTDDLVKIEISPGGWLGQAYKFADLTGNAKNLGIVGDLAVDANGILHLSSPNTFATFDMRTVGSFTEANPAPGFSYAGLLFMADGTLIGTRDSLLHALHTINPASGDSQGWIPNVPLRPFTDLAGPQNRVPVNVPQGVHYFSQHNSSIIRELDLPTGGHRIISWGAPWNIGGIAYEPESETIFYSEQPGAASATHLAKYEVNLDRHTELGSIVSASLGYVPSAMPKHLTFFNGDVYYIAPNTDDLVKVTISDSAVLSSVKVADMNANNSLGDIGAVSIDQNGMLYLARSSGNLLAKFNLYTLSGYTVLSTAVSANHAGLTFDPSNALYGFPAADSSQIYSVDKTTGVTALLRPLVPSVDVWDITGNNASPPPDIPGNYYAVGGLNTRIYKFDPATGVNGPITTTAPFPLRALARDPENNILYYTEEVPSGWRLGKFDIATATHTILGSLTDPSLQYVPSLQPRNLFFYGGALFYVARDSDNLIMVQTDGTRILAQVKVADLTNNSVVIGSVGDVGVDANGIAYATSDSSPRLFRFNMKTLGGYSVISSTLPHYFGALFTESGNFVGTHGNADTHIYNVNHSTGTHSFAAVTQPVRQFVDMAGHEISAPWGKSDSLWAIVEDAGATPAAVGYTSTPAAPNGATNAGGNSAAWSDVRFAYDTSTHVLTGSITLDKNALAFSDPADQAAMGPNPNWRTVTLAVSDGATPSPNASAPTHGVFFLDMSSGTPKLSVYRYTSPVASNITNPTTILSANATAGALSVTDKGNLRTFAFALDVTAVQEAMGGSWQGALAGATIGGRLRAWSNSSVSYNGNGEITSWNPGSLPSGSEDHLSHLTIAGAATTSLEGRLIEFKNYRTPLIEKRDWGLISMQDGAGLATLDNGSGIESLTIAADGTAYFVRNGATVLDGVTYQRPMFKLQVGSQNPGQAAVATFVGDLAGALASLGAAATDPVTGLAAGLDGTLYGVVQHGDGSVPDRLFSIVNFLRDSTGQLINVFSQGLLQGSGSEVTSAGDLSFSSNGTLYVADDSDDEIYTVEKLTGTILGLHSSGDAGNLRGLAVNPADDDVTASDGGSNRIMRLIAGSANDTPYFDYAARFGMSDIRAISFYNGSFSPTESAAPYFAVDQTQRIFGVDPATGNTTLVTATAPFALDAIAYDQAGGVLYYVENTDANFRLGAYTLASNSHAILGNLEAGNYSFNPTLHPRHLVFYSEALYYVSPNSDDLIRIRIAGGSITAQEKASDVNRDNSLGMVRGAALNDTGMLYLTNDVVLMKYNLRTLSGYTVVAPAFGSYESLLWNSSAGTLHGAATAALTRVDTIGTATGYVIPGSLTAPPVALHDMSGPNSAAPSSSFDTSIFAVTGGNRTIHAVNPTTGQNSVLDSAAPFNISALAFDADNAQLYYLEDTADPNIWRFGRYSLNASVHTVLGNIKAASLAYRPAERPRNLAFFNGDVYYIPKNSDDLVRVSIVGTTIAAQIKLADLRSNTAFVDVGDIAVTPGGMMFFSDNTATRPIYRYDLTTLSGFQQFGTASRYFDALTWFGSKLHAAGGTTAIDGLNYASGLSSAGSVTTAPARAFVDFASPVPGAAIGRSGSLWAVAEAPSGNVVEFRNYRNAQLVEAVDYGPIYVMDGATQLGLSSSGCKIHAMTVTNTGRMFFVNDEPIAIGGQSFERGLFHVDLGTLVLGQPVIATFDGDLKQGLTGIGSNDRITGVGIGPDGIMYGTFRADSATAPDYLFRITSLRVNPSKSLVDVTVVDQMVGINNSITEVEDLAFGPDGTLYASDNKTDMISMVNRATATVTDVFSYENNINYLGVTIDPADDAMIGTHVSGSQEKVIRLVTPGNAPDQVLFDFGPFGYSRIEAMSFYTRPFVAGEGALYAVAGSNRKIYTVNSANGQTTQIDNESPTPTGSLVSLAYDAPANQLYYTDAADAGGHFRLYGYSLINDAHSLIGQLDVTSFAYPVTQAPTNLTCINGDLYFVHRDSDDLVRIRHNGTAITAIDKMADLSGDAINLGEVGDLSVRDDGVLYLAANAKLYRYNLQALGFFQEVAPTSMNWKALAFTGGNLVANRMSVPTSIYFVNSTDATDVFVAPTTPSVNISDFASSQPVVTLPTQPAAPYFGVNGTSTIFTVDPDTGSTTVLTSGALFNAAALACDGASYILYYVEASDVDFRLGRFDISSGQHTILGNMKAASFAYVPSRHPHHLAFYNGDLYYINRDSDDLVRMKVSGSSILSQEKITDLNGDLSLNNITAAAVDDDGVLYAGNANTLISYGLRSGGGTTVVNAGFPQHDGWMWVPTMGKLAGVAAASRTRIDRIARTTGAVETGPVTVPAVSFIDLAAGNTAPPPGSALYFGVNQTNRIYQANPLTGSWTLLPTSAAYNVDSIAYDLARGLLYVIESTNTNTRLGRYDLATNTFTNLGNMRASNWSFVPMERPQHLCFYNGDLYYVNYDASVTAKRDDLIRIRVSDSAILAQEKVADLAADAGLSRLTAATVDDLGWMYFSSGSLLRKYDLRSLNGLATINGSTAIYSGLLWHSGDNFLYGTVSNSNNTRNQFTRISVATGAGTLQASVNPQVTNGFHDVANGNRAQPPPSLDVPRAYIGGEFADGSGNFRNLARLNSDGTLDASFNTGIGADGPVRTLCRLSNGQVLAGGEFGTFQGVTRHGLVRVNPDGSIDSSFNPTIYTAGATTEVTLDWANWTTFAQNMALNGSDPWFGDRNAYYGLSGSSGGVAGFASQVWYNVSGSGVNMTLHVSQNMTESSNQLQGPDLYGDTSGYTGGINPDRRITGHTALRYTTDKNGATIAPTTVVASFSEPVYVNQAVWGSLSSLGGLNSTSATNLVSNGSFETGPGWNNGPDWFPTSGHPNRRAARQDVSASGIVDDWSSDRMTWIEDASRAAEGNRFVWLSPSNQNWNYAVVQDLVVGAAAGAGIDLVSGKQYRITINCAAFHPHQPAGSSAFTARPILEYRYQDSNNQNVFAQLPAIDSATSQPAPHYPAQSWDGLGWRTVTATFTAPATSSSNQGLAVALSLEKGATGQMSNGTNHMSNYNLICFEDLSATGDIDGKSWIGGNITSPLWFQMGDQYTPVPNDYVVVVCGTVGGTSGGAGINFSGGSNAKLVVKDSASRGARPINWNGGGSQSTRLKIDPSIVGSNAAMRADLEQRSLAYAGLPANSSVITPAGQPTVRTFQCSPQTVNGQSGIAVFAINDSDLFENLTLTQVDIESATGNADDVKGAIINVSGGSVNWVSNFMFGGGFLNASWRQKVIWNFHGATQLVAGAHPMSGAVLAPFAAVTSLQTFDGALVCRSLTTTGECHRLVFLPNEVINLVGTPAGLLIDNVQLTEAPTYVGSQFENAYFRAFAQPDATGNPVPADAYANISERTVPLMGTGADPVTTVDPNNVRMDHDTADGIYHTIGTGAQEDGRYGRVSFSYTSQPVRSLAFSSWTTTATETVGVVNLPAFNAPLVAGDGASTFTVLGFTRATPPQGKVYAIIEQPDGRILIGGDFGQINGAACKNVARLNPDGTLDPSFNPGLGPNGPVYALALRSEGSVLVGGSFSTWNGQPSGNRLVALNAAGGRDLTYAAGVSSGPSDVVNWLEADPSGKAVVGGKFSAPRNGIARLNSNGSNDTGFDPGSGVGGSIVWSGVLLPGGSLLIGGDFTSINGTTRNRIARLVAGGGVDPAWDPSSGFDNAVQSMALLSGSTFVHTAGGFTSFRGSPRNKAAVVGVSDASAGMSPWGPTGLSITRVWSVR